MIRNPSILVSRKWKNSIVAFALTARAWEFPLAQSVERWTPLPEVPGSNLGTGTLDVVASGKALLMCAQVRLRRDVD